MIVETYKEFCERMDCEVLAINGRWCFRNGAVSDGMWQHNDPPRDEMARLKAQRIFLKFKHDKNVKLFNEITQENLDATERFLKWQHSPPPNPQAPDALRRIRAVVLELREEIAEIDAILNKKPENQHEAARERMRRERQAEVIALREEIKKVTL
jgi:hypothetical protein